jgi:hypothetical protein
MKITITKKEFYEALLREQIGFENYERCALIKEVLDELDETEEWTIEIERDDDETL